MSTTPVSLLEQLRSPHAAQAWTEFVKLYTPLLFHWSQRLGLDRHDASDLLQDVFVQLVRTLPAFQYDPARRFRGWLWTVFRNLSRQRLRRPALAAGPLGEAEPITPDPAEEVDAAEYQRHVVARALELMQAECHPTTWRACWAVVVDGRPAAEVAAELGMTVNAVYVAKGRVLRRLREKLEGLLD